LTSKFIHIDRLQYVLIRFFDDLVVAYFLGHPVYTPGTSSPDNGFSLELCDLVASLFIRKTVLGV